MKTYVVVASSCLVIGLTCVLLLLLWPAGDGAGQIGDVASIEARDPESSADALAVSPSISSVPERNRLGVPRSARERRVVRGVVLSGRDSAVPNARIFVESDDSWADGVDCVADDIGRFVLECPNDFRFERKSLRVEDLPAERTTVHHDGDDLIVEVRVSKGTVGRVCFADGVPIHQSTVFCGQSFSRTDEHGVYFLKEVFTTKTDAQINLHGGLGQMREIAAVPWFDGVVRQHPLVFDRMPPVSVEVLPSDVPYRLEFAPGSRKRVPQRGARLGHRTNICVGNSTLSDLAQGAGGFYVWAVPMGPGSLASQGVYVDATTPSIQLMMAESRSVSVEVSGEGAARAIVVIGDHDVQSLLGLRDGHSDML